MSIAAEGGATPPTVPDAAARVLEFTQVARPEDVPLILKALSTTELNAGIVRLGLRLPEAVIDHVVVQGPPAARTTLAWQLRLPPSRPAAVRRISLARALGSLTAKEVIEHAVPASVVLDLAWRSGETILPAARGRADLAEQLRARLADRIGDDVPLWGTLLLRSLVWSGTVAELIDSIADLGAEQAFPSEDELEEFDEPAREVRTVNVLLAFARPEVGRAALADEPGELSPYQLALLDSRPLAPGLVDRALAGDSGFDARRVLAGNPVTPRAALRRLLHDTADPRQTRLAMLYDVPDPDIRYAALELLEKSGNSWAQIMHFVKNPGEARVYQLVAAAPSAERVHFLLKEFGPYLGPDTTTLLYARLAMAGGDAGPLLMAAESVAYQEIPGATVPDPDQCYDPHPDDPAHWPLENAVRQHLDNRPHRWRIMVRRLMEAGPLEYAQLVDLVQTVGGAGEPSKGEP